MPPSSIDCGCFACISSSEAGMLEFCGQFSHVATPGFTCILCPFYSLANVLSLKVQLMNITCDTKTLDNVFCNVSVAVMYKVIAAKSVDANYKLSDPRPQIKSYVLDVIRSALPRMELDVAFTAKDTIAQNCKDQLTDLMEKYGYKIEAVLVTDLEPDAVVKRSMNDINASQRLRLAAAEKAEAEKILQVKAAEADADSKYLSGQGVARQRTAVVDGLRETVTDFSESVSGTSSSDVLDLLLVTQYFDMMKEVGNKCGNKSIFLQHNPTAVGVLRKDMKTGLMPMVKMA